MKSHQIMCVGPLLAPSYEPLAHHWNEASLSFFYSYHFGRGSSELVPLPNSCIRSTRYCNRLHDFPVTFRTCCKDVYVNSFFPHTARHGNSLPAEHFHFIYDLNGSTCRVNEYFFLGVFLYNFPLRFSSFLLFLLTSSLVVALQPCMDWPQFKKIGSSPRFISNRVVVLD